MTAGTRGSARERQVMSRLRAEGWVVYRAAGSHGCADLVALRCDVPPRLIQVKASSVGPYEHFGREARRALVAEAHAAGAEPWLCWWPSRKPMQWLPAHVWPHAVEA